MSGPWAGRLLLVVLLWLLGGRVGLLVGAVIAVGDAVRSPAPRELLWGSLALFAAVPLAMLVRGLPTRATLGPDLAAGNPAAHLLAGTALALLVLGVLREVRAGRPPPADRPGERALVARRPDRPGDGGLGP
ncbi:MAG TPA: hypothetical protein VGS14_01245 [Actinomycetes bacterium]|jgi:hypothetical protein|nr:hypothetical protein [Actinomycetes bacterium]